MLGHQGGGTTLSSTASATRGKQKKGATVPKWNEKCILVFQFPASLSLETSIMKNLSQKRIESWQIHFYENLKKKKKIPQINPQKQPS